MKSAEVAQFWEANAENWTRFVRAGYDVYRDAQNTPAFLALLPDLRGLCGLDIGCGEGANTRKLVRLGAEMQAIDVAPTFIRHAKAREDAAPLGIHYQVANGQDLPFASETFDFATAFMSLMDMPDHGQALKEAARVLRPGGFFQFSILHPCFAPPYRRVVRDARGRVQHIEVGRYFESTNGVRERVDLHQPARPGTPAGEAVSHADVPSHAEQLGRPDLRGRTHRREAGRADGQRCPGRRGADRRRYACRAVVSAHSSAETGVGIGPDNRTGSPSG